MGLVDALIRAQSGYRSDVAAMVDQLKRSEVFAPLQVSGNLPSKPTTLAVGTSVALHNLPSANGGLWIALFSSVETLQKAGQRHNWLTDGGPLRFVGFKWDAAIEGMFSKALETGANAGIVFDEGSRSELALNASEVIRIAQGQIIPLVDYAARQPARGGEQVFVGEPATPPPPELLEAVRATLATEKGVASYRLVQVYSPERDVMPHLLLDIESQSAEPDRRRISQLVGEAIKDIRLAPPGYVDVAFNFTRH